MMKSRPVRSLSPEKPVEVKFLPLVVKKAKECWLKLPPQTRAWVSLDDLIQEGVLFVKYEALSEFKPKKSSLLVFLWMRLESFFTNKMTHHYRKCRFDGRNVSLNSILQSGVTFSTIEEELSAIKAATQIYRFGSPTLRSYLIYWFRPEDEKKIHTSGTKFSEAVKEFNMLGRKFGMGVPEFQFLMQHEHVCWKLPFLQ